MNKVLVFVLVLCALAGVASQGEAQVIATRTRTASTVVPPGACPPNCPFVALNNAGSVSMNFVTIQDNQRVVIAYNAECTVNSPGQETFMAIRIFVDGVQAPPSSSDKAFCTSDDGGGHWVSAVTMAVMNIAEPGIHAVRVRADLLGEVEGTVDGVLDDSTIIIQK
jgi:hypothetical protein